MLVSLQAATEFEVFAPANRYSRLTADELLAQIHAAGVPQLRITDRRLDIEPKGFTIPEGTLEQAIELLIARLVVPDTAANGGSQDFYKKMLEAVETVWSMDKG